MTLTSTVRVVLLWVALSAVGCGDNRCRTQPDPCDADDSWFSPDVEVCPEPVHSAELSGSVGGIVVDHAVAVGDREDFSCSTSFSIEAADESGEQSLRAFLSFETPDLVAGTTARLNGCQVDELRPTGISQNLSSWLCEARVDETADGSGLRVEWSGTYILDQEEWFAAVLVTSR